MIRRRIYLRTEGWYYVFVIVFVIGGAVLRNVNLLVALGGLMAAALILHWQLVVRSLSGVDLLRSLPSRLCAGDHVEVEVTVNHRSPRGTAWALEFTDRIERVEPPENDPATEAQLLFPRVAAGDKVTRRYQCLLAKRGLYQFGRATVATRYPLGLVEGTCLVDMPDRVVVYPTMGQLERPWQRLVEAEQEGQQSSHHRRGLTEGDFYGLREWRNGDSQRWIHWRTSAKLGTLAVRQFERRRSSDLVLLVDLWSPSDSTFAERQTVERVVSFAATVLADLCRRGGAEIGLVLASREVGHWSGAASALFTQELLEHLAICRASDGVRLADAADRLREIYREGSKLIVVSTRSRESALQWLDRKTRDAVKFDLLEQATWLDASAGELAVYFSAKEAVQ